MFAQFSDFTHSPYRRRCASRDGNVGRLCDARDRTRLIFRRAVVELARVVEADALCRAAERHKALQNEFSMSKKKRVLCHFDERYSVFDLVALCEEINVCTKAICTSSRARSKTRTSSTSKRNAVFIDKRNKRRARHVRQRQACKDPIRKRNASQTLSSDQPRRRHFGRRTGLVAMGR